MKEMNRIEEQNRQLLWRTLAALENEAEVMRFIRELCTPQEIKAIAQRLAAAELLVQNFTYGDITKMLKGVNSTISTATINRVNGTVKNGGGALRMIIQRTSGVEGR